MRRTIVVGYGALLAVAVGLWRRRQLDTRHAGGMGGDAGHDRLGRLRHRGRDHRAPRQTPGDPESAPTRSCSRPGRTATVRGASSQPRGTANSYVLDVTGARYGLAYGCGNAVGDNITITVIHATVAETARVTVACGAAGDRDPGDDHRNGRRA